MGQGSDSNPSDVNFFATQRNDVPAQPNGLQQEVYKEWQPGQPQAPGRIAQSGDQGQGYVTIHDGAKTIIAYAGSTVNIYDGQCDQRRVGSSQNGYVPNHDQTMSQVQASRQAAVGRGPYYGADNSAGYVAPTYQNVNGGGYEVPPPYIPQPNPVGQFFAGIGAMLSIGFGGRGGYGRHGGYMPYRPPFYPGRGGVQIGFGVQPSWAYNNTNYYNTGAYYNTQAAGFNQTQYDANGNPIYYS